MELVDAREVAWLLEYQKGLELQKRYDFTQSELQKSRATVEELREELLRGEHAVVRQEEVGFGARLGVRSDRMVSQMKYNFDGTNIVAKGAIILFSPLLFTLGYTINMLVETVDDELLK